MPRKKNKVMATRSSSRCCISQISLSPDDVEQVGGKHYHKGLLTAWQALYGGLPDADDVEPAHKQSFIEAECNKILTDAATGTYSVSAVQRNVSYMKVLVSWLARTDARAALELLSRALSVLQELDDEQFTNPYADVFVAMLSSFLLQSSQEATLEDLDAIKAFRPRMDAMYSAIHRWVSNGVLQPNDAYLSGFLP